MMTKKDKALLDVSWNAQRIYEHATAGYWQKTDDAKAFHEDAIRAAFGELAKALAQL